MGRKIEIGQSDFKTIIDKNYLYIDKTEFIKNIIDNSAKVAVITRPRKYGKTLNMSMLKYFFSIQEKENRYLFKDLKITKLGEKYKKEQNKYPVIYLSLREVKSETYEKMIINLKNAIYKTYSEHINLLESNKIYEFEKKEVKAILNQEEDSSLKISIKMLAEMLNRHYGQKVIILLDEYDVPIKNAYINGYHKEAIDFFKPFYAMFKDNNNIEKIVMTGEIEAFKESIFSRSK